MFILLSAQLTVDSDNDGLPNDFEENNSLNPEGANLARLLGVSVLSSSARNGPATNAVGSNTLTSGSVANISGSVKMLGCHSAYAARA